MILYFSATGNGKYIAEQIAAATDEKCISIIDCIRGDKYSFIAREYSQEKNTELNYISDGVLTLDQIVDVLRSTTFVNQKEGVYQEYSRTEISYILELMERFQISYKINFELHTDYKEFIPSLCQAEEPEDIKEYMSDIDLQFEIGYDYLPSNILHRLMISRFEELNAGGKWWFI